jgi:2,3-bisphosphoglycerate-dependent phosphoglycerate mutase
MPYLYRKRPPMPILVLVRHGQSIWNLENRFTGETDIPLTAEGREEALAAGSKLRDIPFFHAFTSVLQRAIDTLSLILQTAHQQQVPVTRDCALNERNYGQLQGLNKADVAALYGDDQVSLWRRSYRSSPPGGESLADTAARVIPYYQTAIAPLLTPQQNILVVAHGNSLRSLVMYLERISEHDIADFDLPTGVPRRYTIDENGSVKLVDYL